MTAFKRALEVGTDMLELDCHITLDEQVVVAHDSILDKKTDVVGPISSYKYSELPQMRKELSIDFMPGVVFSGPNEDRRIPLLEEVFQYFPNTPINIDIKVDNDLLISKVSDLIKKYERERITVWGNMKHNVVQKCYKANPSVCLLFSLRKTLALVFLFYSGLLPFVPIKESHLEIFVPSHLMRLYQKKCGYSKWYQTFLAKAATVLLIRKSLFKHLEKRGVQTYLWVMNTDEDFRMAFETGAIGVMTDYPSKLQAFLEENPQYIN